MLLDDIATYLAAQSTRLTVGTNLTKGFMPEQAGTVTTIYETGGFEALHYMTTSTGTRSYERPGLMIHTRSTGYADGRLTIEDVFTILDGVHDTTLPTATGTPYVSITAVQSPFLTGRDSNDRYVFSVNFDVTKTTG